MVKGFREERYAASQQEVANRFGITRQRVEQIERQAIRKLRKALVANAQASGMTVEEWLFGNTHPDDTQLAFQEFERIARECAA